MKIGIITDSTASLSFVDYKHPAVKIIDFTVAIDDEVYKISQLDPDDFYIKMAAAKSSPKTSQGSVQEVLSLLTAFKEEGYTDVIVMTISSKLSGSLPNIIMAGEEVEGLNLHVVDSLSTAIMLGDAVRDAAKLVDEELPLEDILKSIEQMYDNDGAYFYVDQLKYLVKGGRMSGAAGFVGGMLKIKPILQLSPEGTVELKDKNRTKSKSIQTMVDHYLEISNGKKHKLYGFYTDNKAEVEEFMKQFEQNENVESVLITGLTPAVSAHTGPGVIGIGWRFI